MATTWTPERTETAKKLWAEGYSASQIAGQLGGVTRNAVIGKLNRIGANSPRALIQRTRPAARSRKWKVPKQPKFNDLSAAQKFLSALKAEPYVVREKPHVENPKPLQEIPDNNCRFIVTDHPPHLYCDRKQVPGLSWCEAHCAVVFNPEPLRALRPPFEGGGLGLRFQNKRILEHTE